MILLNKKLMRVRFARYAMGMITCFVFSPVMVAHADMTSFTKAIDALVLYNERPLFSPSRRPANIPAPAEIINEPVATQPMNAVLLGVVSATDGSGLAILRVEGQADVQRVRVGDAIDGWTLDRVESHAAVFSSGGQNVTLTFPQTGETNNMVEGGSNDMPVAPDVAPVLDPAAP